jgi:hypothetical protein
MRDLIELYEMICLNSAALRDSEKPAMRKAQRALRAFRQAMESLNTSPAEASAPETSLRMAA